jgi:HNH endonuclease
LETLHEKTLTPAIIAPMLDVGRKTRSIPPAIRRALNARDPGCCFPGCTYQRYLDAHHVEHWADGGETKLKNLVHLCRTHHRLVHEGGIAVKARAGGGWRFSRPDGREFDIPYREAATAQDWTALRDTHAALGIEIDSDTAATRWRGERMDYELGVWVLCQEHARAQHGHAQAERGGADHDEVDPASNAASDVSAETPHGFARYS